MDQIAEKPGKNLAGLRELSGYTLYSKLKAGEIDAAELTPVLRRMCVRFLRYEMGASQGQISDLLKCTVRTIRSDYRKIEGENLFLINEFDVRKEFVETITRLEIYEQRAIASGHIAKAAKIRIDRIGLLQSLGFLPKDLGTLNIKDGQDQKKEMEIIDLGDLAEDQQEEVNKHWDAITEILSKDGAAEEGPKALKP